MQLVRSHGLGNDYLILASEGPAPSPALVRALCDRHTGVGSDGLLLPWAPGAADYGLRIFNPDGSEAEKSGNGLRIFARYLVDHRGAPDRFTVSTPGGVVACEVAEADVTVEMGRASFEPEAIPLALPEAVDQRVEVEGRPLRFTALTVGNPHCVLFTEAADLDALPWRRWGRALEVHPLFPQRVNVQLARVDTADSLTLRIWERGAGETSASGSSSCAVAAAAVRTGRCAPGRLTLRMPGGALEVTVSPELDLRLRGPVEEIAQLTVSEGWLLTRAQPDARM